MLRKHRFFFRLLLLYVIVVLVYALIASNILFSKNRAMYEKEITSNKEIFLTQSAGEIDDKLKVVFNLITKIRTDNSIRSYLDRPGDEEYHAIQVSNELAKIQNSFSDMAFYIAIGKTGDDRVVSAEETATVPFYFQTFGAGGITLDQISEELNSSDLMKPYFARVTSVEEVGKEVAYLTLVKEEVTNSGNDFYVYITFRMDQFIPAENILLDDTFALLDNEGTVLFSTRPEHDGRMLQAVTSEGGTSDTSEDTVLSRKSNVMNWNYAYRYAKQFGGRANSATGPVLICFLLIVIGGAVGYLILRKLYRPVNHMVDVLRPFGKDEDQDDLTYIQETALKITDANQRLRKLVDDHRAPLKDKFLRDVLNGLITKDAAEAGMQRYDLPILGQAARVVVMEFANYDLMQDAYLREDILEIQSQMNAISREWLSRRFAVEASRADARRNVLIVSDGGAEELEQELQHIVLDIEAEFEIVLVCAVGTLSHDVTELSESYRRAKLVLEQQAYGANRSVVSADRLAVDMEDFYYPIDLEKELINSLVRNNKQASYQLLEEITEENLKKRQLNHEAVGMFLLAVSNTVNRVLQISGKKIEDVFEDGMIVYLELKTQKDPDVLTRHIFELFDAVIAMIDRDSQQTEDTVKDLMFEYIHENYNHDIALQDLAEHFNFSRTYISTLFKELTSYNFKEYLSRYRVEMAKQKLEENPQMKINDLARELGFNSANTFIRIFNKYEKLSPGQYVKEQILRRDHEGR